MQRGVGPTPINKSLNEQIIEDQLLCLQTQTILNTYHEILNQANGECNRNRITRLYKSYIIQQ